MTPRTVSSLNAARRRSVELRQQGRTLENVARATGLSIPTIIAACKAYERGGWAAVDVARRGRRAGSGSSIPAEQAVNVRDAILETSPEMGAIGCSLWDFSALSVWIEEQFGLSLTPRTLTRQAARWGLQMADLEASQSERDDEPGRDWRSGVFEPLAAHSRRDGSRLMWGAVSSVGDGYELIYAQTRRGKFHWLIVQSPVTSETIKDFMSRLHAMAGRKVHLLWCGADLSKVADVQGWLNEHRNDLELHLVPPAGTSAKHAIRELNARESVKHQNPENVTRTPMTLTHLQRLEAESIHIMREVVAEADNPVMLYSIGKDSAVMLHLAMKAFYPAKPPFPLLHVDTQWKFREMYKFRDSITKELGVDLLVHINPEGKEKGINPFTHGSAIHTDIMKTEGLKQALDKFGFDAAFGGARRDEEKSRAKERIFSFRTAQHRWDPKSQRPELWKLYNARKHKGESMRVFPLSNWTELDIWQYIYLENIPIVPLYYSAERPVVERDGTLIMVDDDRMPLKPGEVPMMKKVRFRTLGCYPLTGAVESEADTLPAIIQEMLLTKTSERQGRVIDHDSAASMEKKKQEGYF